MKRRNFIKQSALVATLFKPLTMLGGSLSSNDLSEQQWKTIVDYARWCPSIHNLQPHRIKVISPQTAALYYDADRLLPKGDPKSVFSRVALGVFIENLSIAAGAYGKGIEVDKIINSVDFTKNGLIHFANLKVVDNANANEIDRTLILKRRTARGKYHCEKIVPSTLKKIELEAKAFGHSFQSTSNDSFVDFMVNMNQETLFEDLGNDTMRKELDQLFRYDDKTAKLKKDGLSARCMGFPGQLMRSVFQKHHKWTKGIRKKVLRKRYLQSFKGTQTIGWFTGRFDTTEELLQAGRMFARAWLRITEDGAYIQPFGSLITNKNAYAQMQQELQIEPNKERLWLIFRIGYSNLPAKSERLDLDTVLINENNRLFYS